MITLITENIPCDGNRMVIYSPNVANEISACDFTGYFKKYGKHWSKWKWHEIWM